MLTQILEPHGGDLVLHLLVRRGRQADAARLRQGLETGGYVDAIAVEVAVLHDHVAKVEADPKHQSPVLWYGVVALGHTALDIDRAPDRVDHTGELDEQVVAGRLDDSAGVLGYGGIDQLAEVRRQHGQGAVLVGAHEPAVAGDVGRKDRAEPPRVGFRCHARVP